MKLKCKRCGYFFDSDRKRKYCPRCYRISVEEYRERTMKEKLWERTRKTLSATGLRVRNTLYENMERIKFAIEIIMLIVFILIIIYILLLFFLFS